MLWFIPRKKKPISFGLEIKRKLMFCMFAPKIFVHINFRIVWGNVRKQPKISRNYFLFSKTVASKIVNYKKNKRDIFVELFAGYYISNIFCEILFFSRKYVLNSIFWWKLELFCEQFSKVALCSWRYLPEDESSWHCYKQ